MTLKQKEGSQAFFLGAFVVGACFPVDTLLLGEFRWGPLYVRAAWAAGMLAMGLAQVVSPRPIPGGYPRAGSILAIVGFSALAAVTGGTRSPIWICAAAMPLACGLFLRDDRLGSLIASATMIACAIAVTRYSGASWGAVLAASMLIAAVGAIADLSARQAIAVSARELEARQAERASAENSEANLRRLAESELRRLESERLASVGRLAAGVAHEVNNPLAFVQANLQYLREELGTSLSSEHEQVLEETSEGISRITQIVRDLQQLARPPAAELVSTDLTKVVADAVRLASVRTRPVCDVHLLAPVERALVNAVPNRLVQVLVNLLANSADALAEAPGAEPARIQVAILREGDELVIAVDDNGPGIPSCVGDRIFEPFFTTKAPGKGTGLGLALCREYVEQCKGTIEASRSQLGGARFELRLPGNCLPSLPALELQAPA